MEQINTQVSKLLEKEMDRKDFLKHVGLGFVAATGALGLIKNLNGLGLGETKQVARGYGSSVYGGVEPKRRVASTASLILR